MMQNIEMIFGAPGCGKTTYLINLLQDLLNIYEPNEIAFVSFTRKGSYEGRDRAIELFNYKEEDFPYFRTLHSIAFRELGLSKYDIISFRHYKDFSSAMGMHFVGYYTEDFNNNDDKYLFYISLEKNNIQSFENSYKELNYTKFESIKENYIRYKKEANIYDFDDIIQNFIKQNKSIPVKIAIIDEAQDLTTLQWEFCNIAFKNCEKVFIAGDDDQAIYEWNGADVKHFLSLTENSPVKVLDKSYRLKKKILNYSNTISHQIKHRVEKIFEPSSNNGDIGGLFYYNHLEEIPINSEQNYYLLNRNNYFLPIYKKFIMKKGLIFTYKNKISIDPKIYGAIKRYERYRKVSFDESFKKDNILKAMLKKDISSYKNVPWYDAFELPVNEITYYRDLFKNKTNPEENNITISTIHGVKGGEADNVVLMLDVTRNVYSSIKNNTDSELRCLYVALTRAKKNLHIVYSNSKFGYEELL